MKKKKPTSKRSIKAPLAVEKREPKWPEWATFKRGQKVKLKYGSHYRAPFNLVWTISGVVSNTTDVYRITCKEGKVQHTATVGASHLLPAGVADETPKTAEPSKPTPHPHAALMMEYAKDAAETNKPWERWEEVFSDGTYMQLTRSPTWMVSCRYRRKPQPKKYEVWLTLLADGSYFSNHSAANAEKQLEFFKREGRPVVRTDYITWEGEAK